MICWVGSPARSTIFGLQSKSAEQLRFGVERGSQRSLIFRSFGDSEQGHCRMTGPTDESAESRRFIGDICAVTADENAHAPKAYAR